MRILVAGGGIAGLAAALALSGEGRTVEIIERDPAPPGGDADAIFEMWERKGVAQLRQGHAFHARIADLIRRNHPELYERMLAAGVRELRFDRALPPELAAKFQPTPEDFRLTALISRRATLEAVMRVYAQERVGAIFHTGHRVSGIVCAPGAGGAPTAKAFKVEKPDGTEEIWEADLLLDATGRNTVFPDWLKVEGVDPEVDEAPINVLYCTRNYRLHQGVEEPPRPKPQRAGYDVGFIRGGAAGGDNRSFVVMLILPEIETELRQVIVYPEVWDAFTRKMPAIAPWVDTERSDPISKVYAMGNLMSTWRHWVKDGAPLIHNFFAVGDATSTSNPLYGRGCSLAMMHAYMLRDILEHCSDPAERARRFDGQLTKEIRPFYEAMKKQDLGLLKSARNAQNPSYRPGLKERIANGFANDAVQPLLRKDPAVMRGFMRSAAMFAPPKAWIQNPVVIAKLVLTWMTPRSMKTQLPALEGDQLVRSEFLAIAHEKLASRKPAEAA